MIILGKINLHRSRGHFPLVEAKIQAKIFQLNWAPGALVDEEHKLPSPLHAAVSQGRAGTVQLLLDGGADIDRADNMGQTPLFRAVWSGRRDVVQLLIKRGAQPNIGSTGGYTPLHVAAAGHYTNEVSIKLIKPLIEAGADPERRDDRGQTPIQYARNLYHMDVVRELVKGRTKPR